MTSINFLFKYISRLFSYIIVQILWHHISINYIIKLYLFHAFLNFQFTLLTIKNNNLQILPQRQYEIHRLLFFFPIRLLFFYLVGITFLAALLILDIYKKNQASSKLSMQDKAIMTDETCQGCIGTSRM